MVYSRILEVGDSVYESFSLGFGSVRCRQQIKLLACHLPRDRLADKPWIVAAFFDQSLPIAKSNLDAARHFLGKTLRVSRLCAYKDPAKEFLDVLAANPVQFVLGRHDVAI